MRSRSFPANVLIGRDGKVVTFDQWDADLLDAVAGGVEASRVALGLARRRRTADELQGHLFPINGAIDDVLFLLVIGSAPCLAGRVSGCDWPRGDEPRLSSAWGSPYPGVPLLLYTPERSSQSDRLPVRP